MIQHNICHNKIAYHEHEIADNARTHARSHARSHTPTLARSHAPALARSHAPTCIHCLHVHMLCPLIRCYVCPAGGTRRAAGTCTPSFPTDGSYHAVCIYMCTYIYIYIYIPCGPKIQVRVCIVQVPRQMRFQARVQAPVQS